MIHRIKILRYINKLLLWLYFKYDPICCSRRMGVQIGVDCKIYGNDPNMWGTEPFLIRLGNNVHITDGCKFICHDGGTLILRQKTVDLEITAPIIIGNNVYLGLQTIIMPGVSIGDNVIIGARSIVTKDIKSNSVAVGSPAKVIKTVDEYHKKAIGKSLKIGHLKGRDKAIKLREIFSEFIKN